MKFWQVKEQMVLGTLVFETLGQPEKEREFKVNYLASQMRGFGWVYTV